MIKILSIHWGFSLGGVGKYALLIDNAGKHAPLSIQSICILNKDWQCDHEGLKVLNADKIFIRSRMNVSWVMAVVNYIRNYSPDLIMTHGFNGHFVALLTKMISGHKIKLICSYHGLYHATTGKRKLLEPLINMFTEFYIKHCAEKTICVADYSRRYLLGKNIDQEKLSVIHNGIEPFGPAGKAPGQLRGEWGVAEDQVVLGVASRLDPVKGLEYLVHGFKEIALRHKRVCLVILGTGKSEDMLKRQVSEAGMSDRVVFTGFRSDVTDCLAAFDIFVLPSLAEYHSIALLEAMQAGKAIVATNVGGNTESVRHEKEGLIVLPADSDGLAQALERYIEEPELADKMGAKARARFQKYFTVDVMVKKTAAWMAGLGPSR